MPNDTGPIRACERQGWARFCFVHDINDHVTLMRSGLLNVSETNAAANATIVIDRMLRNGRSKWRRKLLDALMRRQRGDVG